MTLKKWTETEIPLGEIALVKLRFGLEETYHENPPLLQVDFANMYGSTFLVSSLSLFLLTHIHFRSGVLSGGCVQRRIRFSISRGVDRGDAILSAMLDGEAIHIIGSEQFSSYKGYGFGLRWWNFKDPLQETRTVRYTAVTAIDALDGRRMGRRFPSQWKMNNVLKNSTTCNKFVPESTESLKRFQELGTGKLSAYFAALAPHFLSPRTQTNVHLIRT